MKAKPNLYIHDFKVEQRTALHLENLEHVQQSMIRVCHALGLRALRRCGEMRLLVDRCPVDKHKVPVDEPDRYPLIVRNNYLLCEPGNHRITIPQTLELFAEDAAAALAKLNVGKSQLGRSYVFETGEEGEVQRAVGTDPHETLAELHNPDGAPVRGVAVESPSIEIARQLAGQKTSRSKMNWCESVPLRPDGTLVDVGWHGAWLTALERLLLAEQKRRETQDRFNERDLALRRFEARQVLGIRESEST